MAPWHTTNRNLIGMLAGTTVYVTVASGASPPDRQHARDIAVLLGQLKTEGSVDGGRRPVVLTDAQTLVQL